jgi:AcrR family transcriptional regulator
MNSGAQTSGRPYKSGLRQAQTGMTRARIVAAAEEVLAEEGGAEAITFKRVAERAGMTEMTVYRHFANRDALLRGLWERINAKMGPGIGMPHSLDELRGQHRALFAGFDKVAPTIVASVTTPQGRAMRAALNAERHQAFFAIVDEIAPGLAPAERRRAAALLQLLHSAFAWDSLREQWGMDGGEAGEATLWLIDLIVSHLGKNP